MKTDRDIKGQRSYDTPAINDFKIIFFLCLSQIGMRLLHPIHSYNLA